MHPSLLVRVHHFDWCRWSVVFMWPYRVHRNHYIIDIVHPTYVLCERASHPQLGGSSTAKICTVLVSVCVMGFYDCGLRTLAL